jgi:dinuclear metal center YbgI/SA1388 family protein
MIVADLATAMERIAHPSLAEEWDNVGLIAGDPDAPLTGPVLVTVDFRMPVVEEARSIGAGAIVAYHPPIFRPITRLCGPEIKSLAILRALEAGMAIYSPHTAVDAAPGGLNDWLCGALAPEGETSANSFGDRRALAPKAEHDPSGDHKLVVFVPRADAEKVRDALASVGAGHIGGYSRCSYELEGRGTFQGGEGTNPAVGEAGRLERVEEVRLEMVCPGRALGLAREMLDRFHPYEEPAWDVYPLAPKPDRSTGPGRRLTLDRPATPLELAERVKKNLGLKVVKTALASDEPVQRVGVCAGSGADLINAAIEEGCTLFFTGEMSHHEGLAAVHRGCSVLLAGHTNTERGFMPVLASRLSKELDGADVRVSAADTPLFASA